MASAVDSSEVKPPVASESHKNLPVDRQEDDETSRTAKFQVMPDLIGENDESSEDEDKTERRKKFRRYQVEDAQHLKAKYFSNKTFTGDNVFEEEMKIEDETIRCSRWPCTSAFANPAKHFEKKQKLEESSIVPASGVETSTSTTPTKKTPSKKTP